MKRAELRSTIEDAMSGDEDAFAVLYNRYASDILFQSETILYDRSYTDDAAAETVLKLWRNIKNLKSPHAFYSYMCMTVRSVCIDINRKESRRKSSDMDIDDYSDVLRDDNAALDYARVLDEADDAASESAVASALKQLPESQRLCLFLHCFKNMPQKDIAKALSLSASSVATHIARAKKSLAYTLGRTELLSSAVIAGGFAHELSEIYTAGRIAAFTKLAKSKLSSAALPDAHSGSKRVRRISKPALAVCAAAGAAAVLIIAVSILHDDGTREEAPGPFKPDAYIIFADVDGADEMYDPVSAELITDEGSVSAWSITGETASYNSLSGNFAEPSEAFPLLPGEYDLSYTLVAEDGRMANVTRKLIFSE